MSFSSFLVVLLCVMPHCAAPHGIVHVPYRIAPYHTVLHRIARHCTMLYRTYRTLPHGVVPHRTAPYRAIPHRTIPYCTPPYRSVPFVTSRHVAYTAPQPQVYIFNVTYHQHTMPVLHCTVLSGVMYGKPPCRTLGRPSVGPSTGPVSYTHLTLPTKA